ncbi:hypothetical protein RW1_045_00470 [Rhodococcus wratislaviensis NBRC 100605]|jgi:hypothetical protein|uniref:Uncharacterized protein n=1 Tax=Rhodococcus wratislaviensis NBRC 100605 TaxID=1219028 RepID=X0Q8F2_RHOWR|nr:hypothetical protein RW1_045_00470 [Rhodococcus wratislaviensis NBRC 100605]
MSFLPLFLRGRWNQAEDMTILVVVLLVFLALDALALAGRTPDTHNEVIQHGDFRF